MNVTIFGSELTFVNSCDRIRPTVVWKPSDKNNLIDFRTLSNQYWQVDKQCPPNLSSLSHSTLTTSSVEAFTAVIQNTFFKGVSPYQIHFLEPHNLVLFIPNVKEKKLIFEDDPTINYIFSVKPHSKAVVEQIEEKIDGFPFIRYNKIDDKIHGVCEEFYPKSNQVFMRSTFQNGKKNGKEQIFSSQNVLLQEQEYENDQLHGFQKVYEEGNLKRIQEYRKGEKTRIMREYLPNGQPKV
jgi:hypothetical protein